MLDWTVSSNINPAHLVRCEDTTDMSDIGSDAQIDQLTAWFDQASPLYDAADLKDDGTSVSKELLKEHLETFITYVHNRTPFLGTPPAYDVVGLEKFYKKIENMVRTCIHRAKNDLNTQKLLALDFAVAGGHCGARFMSAAIDHYTRANLDASDAKIPLEETLLQYLGNMRRGIALNEAASLPDGVTHGLPQYLRDFGVGQRPSRVMGRSSWSRKSISRAYYRL